LEPIEKHLEHSQFQHFVVIIDALNLKVVKLLMLLIADVYKTVVGIFRERGAESLVALIFTSLVPFHFSTVGNQRPQDT